MNLLKAYRFFIYKTFLINDPTVSKGVAKMRASTAATLSPIINLFVLVYAIVKILKLSFPRIPFYGYLIFVVVLNVFIYRYFLNNSSMAKMAKTYEFLSADQKITLTRNYWLYTVATFLCFLGSVILFAG